MRKTLCVVSWLLVLCCLVGCGAPAGSDPTQAPTQLITEVPTEDPTEEPSATLEATTEASTGTPTQEPTKEPIKEPTKAPTKAPTVAPTVEPTVEPLIKDGMLTPGKAHVILLMGQSNMVGRAQIKYLEQTAFAKELAEYRAGYENIQIYYHIDHQNSDPTNIASGFVPVTLGQGSTTAQFGPEVGLAEYLNKAFPGEKFYLIKCAWSGSGIANNYTAGNSLYTEVLRRTNIGINLLKNAGLDPEIFAFCWMQGETDAMTKSQADNYLANQTDLMNRWLKLYKKMAAPKGIAFIDAGISEQWTYYKTVNAAKVTFQTQGTNRYYIDTIANGLTTLYENNDKSHYDSQSKIKLGRLYGQMIEMYLKGQQQQ
ncbi:MAG: hypothetical protein IKU26_03480 [Clostridia bacterium]|nr:hypothetical protein [Clostridia bacterium]